MSRDSGEDQDLASMESNSSSEPPLVVIRDDGGLKLTLKLGNRDSRPPSAAGSAPSDAPLALRRTHRSLAGTSQGKYMPHYYSPPRMKVEKISEATKAKKKSIGSPSRAKDGKKGKKRSLPVTDKEKEQTGDDIDWETGTPPAKKKAVAFQKSNSPLLHCFRCQRKDSSSRNEKCVACVRLYHMRCMSRFERTSADSIFVCDVCRTIMNAENIDQRASVMRSLKMKDLSRLLQYSLDTLRNSMGEEFNMLMDEQFRNMDPENSFPMNFDIMQRNITDLRYGCPESFLADVKWIYHNAIVTSGRKC